MMKDENCLMKPNQVHIKQREFNSNSRCLKRKKIKIIYRNMQ